MILNKKLIFAILFANVICNYIFSIEYIVIRDTPMSAHFLGVAYSSEFIRNLVEGEKVTSTTHSLYVMPTDEIEMKWDTPFKGAICIKTEFGEEGWVDPDDIDLLGEAKLPSKIVEKRWVNNYYLDIINTQDKKAVFKYEPFWETEYPEINKEHNDFDYPWWHSFQVSSCTIKNNFIEMDWMFYQGFLQFLIFSRKTDKDFIYLSVLCVSKNKNYAKNYFYNEFVEGKEYLFLLKLDGDYLDLYLGNKTNKINTLVSIDEVFIKTLENIVKDKPIAPTEITSWPRRADGSMDYPPPYNMSNFQSTHTTLDNLRLRDSPTTSGAIITTDNQVSAQETKTTFPLLWVLIGAGVIVIAGVVVFVVVKRRGR